MQMTILLAVLLLLLSNVKGLHLSAPARCGGNQTIQHASALFGPTTSSAGVRGVPLHALSPKVTKAASSKLSKNLQLADGCTAVHDKEVQGRVAVVTRGNCEFGQKVLNLQAAKAVGAIIVNNKNAHAKLVFMKLNATHHGQSRFIIPAVMIRYKDWVRIGPCRNEMVTVTMDARGAAMSDIDTGLNKIGLIPVIIGIVVLVILAGLLLWACVLAFLRQKRRYGDIRAQPAVDPSQPTGSQR